MEIFNRESFLRNSFITNPKIIFLHSVDINYSFASKNIMPDNTTSSTGKRRLFRKRWRTTTAAGVLTVLLVLILNIGFLIWARSRKTDLLVTGDCNEASRISLWSHFAINVFGTLLLATSNNAIQFLASPTRAEVDVAHLKGQWLDIGVFGLRNLKFISRGRLLALISLGVTSIPIHLL